MNNLDQHSLVGVIHFWHWQFINPFPAIQDNCHLLLYFDSLAYIANNMDPDQFAPIEAAWSAFEYLQTLKADIFMAETMAE